MASTIKKNRPTNDRRDDLIQGTIRSIVEVGYSDSTVASICQSAGLSRGLISYYFKNKDELLIEAFRYLTSQADAEARKAIREAGPDPLHRLLAANSMNFKRLKSEQDESLVSLAFLGIARWNSDMLAITHELWRKYRKWIERMMAEAAAERNITIDARKAAITYSQMADGLWIGHVLDPEAYTLEEAEEIVRDWLLDLFEEKQAGLRPGIQDGAAGSTGP